MILQVARLGDAAQNQQGLHPPTKRELDVCVEAVPNHHSLREVDAQAVLLRGPHEVVEQDRRGLPDGDGLEGLLGDDGVADGPGHGAARVGRQPLAAQPLLLEAVRHPAQNSAVVARRRDDGQLRELRVRGPPLLPPSAALRGERQGQAGDVVGPAYDDAVDFRGEAGELHHVRFGHLLVEGGVRLQRPPPLVPLEPAVGHVLCDAHVLQLLEQSHAGGEDEGFLQASLIEEPRRVVRSGDDVRLAPLLRNGVRCFCRSAGRRDGATRLIEPDLELLSHVFVEVHP
mmetsp:Transcript_113262/g.316452  ORF Transcript_113262/g.316452 Transcript_113262/m.316452 type:complete len:286 (-) Transcript_113262:1769-2626(-)